MYSESYSYAKPLSAPPSPAAALVPAVAATAEAAGEPPARGWLGPWLRSCASCAAAAPAHCLTCLHAQRDGKGHWYVGIQNAASDMTACLLYGDKGAFNLGQSYSRMAVSSRAVTVRKKSCMHRVGTCCVVRWGAIGGSREGWRLAPLQSALLQVQQLVL